MQSTRLVATPQEEEAIKMMLDGVEFEGDTKPEIIRLDPNANDVDGAMFEDIETGKPSQMMVMKEVSSCEGQEELSRNHGPMHCVLSHGRSYLILRPISFDCVSFWFRNKLNELKLQLSIYQLLGINIFTYLLGALIVVLLSLNFFLGPGWLGQAMGIQGVGSFDEVSKSLPDTVDLSRPEFRLDL